MSDLTAWTVTEIGERPQGVKVIVDSCTLTHIVTLNGIDVGHFTHRQQVIGGELIIDWDHIVEQLANRQIEKKK